MKSLKPIKDLSDIILPYKIVFPVTVEGSVGSTFFRFPKNILVELDYPVFEALNHSCYSEYLN